MPEDSQLHGPHETAQRSGLQLMEVSSSVINAAISQLAISDPALQRQLSFMPGRLKIHWGVGMESEIISYGTGGFGYDGLLGIRPQGNISTVDMWVSAGQLLQYNDPAELINAMSVELAGYISNQCAESRSCSASWLSAMGALSASAVFTPSLLGLGARCGALVLVVKYIARPWLERQQAYDADAIAAAISTAAGCQPDSILSFMQ